MVGVIEAPGAQLEDAPASWGWDPQRWRERQEDDEGLVVLRTYLERGILPGVAERHAQTQTQYHGIRSYLPDVWETCAPAY